jgi:MGT family glycosyltransferase
MSTAVVFSLPVHGHVNPMLPLVAELVSRGERVVHYALEEFRVPIEHTGAEFRSYPEGFALHPVHGDPRRILNHPNPFLIVRTLLTATEWVLEHMTDEVAGTRPDYVIHDAMNPWGRYMAEILGIPSITSIVSVLVTPQLLLSVPPVAARTIGMYLTRRSDVRRCYSLLRELTRRYGLRQPGGIFDQLNNYSELNFIYTSRLIQPHDDQFDERRYKFVGPMVMDRPYAPAFPFERLDADRPLVYVSLGTMVTDQAFLRTCADAFADTDWQIVMATGSPVTPEWSRALPDNLIAQQSVPQLDILRRASVYVTHCGMGGISESLSNDVPMVAVPFVADQPWNAHRLAELGVARPLSRRLISPRRLRRAVEIVLNQPSYRESARRVGESLRAAGGPRRAADEVQRFLHDRMAARSSAA